MERNYQKLIRKYLISDMKSDKEELQRLLSDDACIQYSNLGVYQGVDSIIQKLCWKNEPFDVNRVTTTNEMHYKDGNKMVVALIGHHLAAYEKNNELFPLVYGGKYIFEIEENKIKKVSFLLEYQNGNTIYVKDKWKLAGNKKNYEILNSIDLQAIYDDTMKNDDYLTLLKLFFWCIDTNNINFAVSLVTDDFTISRSLSFGSEKIEGTKLTLDEFVKRDNSYYSLNQYSFKFNEIKQDLKEIQVYGQHLTPHRIGTKKLNSLTKNSSFFDEDLRVKIRKDSESYYIQSINLNKGTEVLNDFNEIVGY